MYKYRATSYVTKKQKKVYTQSTYAKMKKRIQKITIAQ